MLRLLGAHYHFRRTIPLPLRALLGRTEISLSLQTSSKRVARERAAGLYARTGQFFSKAKVMYEDASPEELRKLLALYKDIMRDTKRMIAIEEERVEAERTYEKARFYFEKMESLKQLQEFIKISNDGLDSLMAGFKKLHATATKDYLRNATEKTMLREQIANLSAIVVSIKNAGQETQAAFMPVQEEASVCPTPNKPTPGPKKKTGPTITEMADQFIYRDKTKSPGIIRDTGKTIGLFVEAFGDKPVDQITGGVAGEFRDMLFALPSTHGKHKNSLGIHDAILRAKEEGLETLSGKTVKNHFSRLSALWGHLVQREIVARNPWAGWTYDVTQKIDRRDWTDRELAKLSTAQWTSTTTSLRSYVGLITIALYTGMRLGELCNLRTQDIVTVNGIRCFHVRPHPEDNWSPKTAAGTRLIPLHSHLLQWGVLDLVQEGEHYLFPDLNPSARGRGTDFAQAFSKFKKRLGLPETVTFHSFRHTVSTKLRNQSGTIRELWIDTLLGHEASHRSQGTTTYTSGIAVQNLQQVVEALEYSTFHIPLPPPS
ncbi:tyrosine-type recombinase/integrase [Acetobacter orientalis]|uniref:tyrosine-type recombinase/integrase n=1 Tax=Acetobacter orientalis TaxID=146474 RepID=UPI00241CA5BF|nr:tyrosine-type recombinase/integrase [Acetobacter orientalis]